MSRWRKTALALVLPLSVGVAQAQEQTPENAQRFLAQIAGLGQISYAWRYEHDSFEQSFYQDASVDYRGDHPPRRYYNKQIAPIWDVTSTQRCFTKFKHRHTSAVWVDTRYQILTREADWTLSWQGVTSVQVIGPEVHLRAGPRFERFTLPGPDLAKRVGYAMEFLRISCDATQGTGF